MSYHSMSQNQVAFGNDNNRRWNEPLYSPTGNSLNPDFVNAIGLITIAILGVFGTFQLINSIRTKSRIAFKRSPISHVMKLYLVGLEIILLVSLFFLGNKSVFIITNAIAITTIILPLHILERTTSKVSLASILLFWIVNILILAIGAVQDLLSPHKIFSNSTISYTIELTSFICSITIFILEFWYFRTEHSNDLHLDLLTDLSLSWVWEMLRKMNAIENPKHEDLPILQNTGLDCDTNYPILLRSWTYRSQEAQLSKPVRKWWFFGKASKPKPSLALAVIATIFGRLVFIFLLQITTTVISYAPPLILRRLILFLMESENSPGTVPMIEGYFLAIILLIVEVSQYVISVKERIVTNKIHSSLDSAISTLLFTKAMKLSPQARRKRSIGQLINHITSDKFEVISTCMSFQDVILEPFELLFCAYLLYGLLGNALWGGVLTVLLIAPFITYVSTFTMPIYFSLMVADDDRTSLLNEILLNIKTIKLHAWEEPMLKKVNEIRNDRELVSLKKIGIVQALMSFLWSCIPFFVSCASFGTFVVINDTPLTADIIYPCLRYLSILTGSLIAFPRKFQDLIEAMVSINRLRDFLLAEEIQLENHPIYKKRLLKEDDENSVKIVDTTFFWDGKGEETDSDDEEQEIEEDARKVAFSDLNFTAKVGEFTCIIGKVGSGKTTLLRSILGELEISAEYSDESIINHRVEINGTIAYCSQAPWILNASVRENILFGLDYDEEFYRRTVDACELLTDLKSFSNGDETLVGERGIVLSGGQKVRVSLARAIYSRADIYLFDDILSAVDAHVGRSLIQKVLSKNGIIGSKTRILASNSINVLELADQIVLLRDRIVVESGSMDTIMNNKGELADFIEEFGSATNYEKIEEDHRAGEEIEMNHGSKDIEVDEEISSKGGMKFSDIYEYLKICKFHYALVFVAISFATESADVVKRYILAIWSQLNADLGYNKDSGYYLGLYAAIGIAGGAFTLVGSFVVWNFCIIRGSKYYHEKLTLGVLRSPMSFFDTTPIGRILNRFSNDISTIDSSLPWNLIYSAQQIISGIIALAVLIFNLPLMIFVVFALVGLYNVFSKEFVPGNRTFTRLTSTTESSVLTVVQESMVGMDTIRAYNQQDRFVGRCKSHINKSIDIEFLREFSQEWLNIRMELISSLNTFFAVIFAINTLLTSSPMRPSQLAYTISFGLSITSTLSSFLYMWTMIESSAISLERVTEYIKLKPEAALIVESFRPPVDWPEKGTIEFKDFSTRYREDSDLVLKNITFSVGANEKIGVVGRTGSGKSSLALSIFRIIEAAEGNISIDGINTSKIGLYDLRKILNIIPQESQLVKATIRENLDPFQQYSDEKLWSVLELSQMKEFIEKFTSVDQNSDDSEDPEDSDGSEQIGLDAMVEESGSNLSAGQKQLLNLSRALLKETAKILVLDEATSSVDVETDKIIQRTIRSEFKDKTVITIAHRIATVLDSDKVLVLDGGEVKEFDTPENLLKDPTSRFYSLCKEGGVLN